MISVETGISVTSVNVSTSDNGGLSTEQIVDLAMDKILNVSDTAPPAIKDQAQAFRDNLRVVVRHYIDLARREERATMAHMAQSQGHDDLAEIIRRL